MLTLQLPAAAAAVRHGLATSDCDSHHLARTFIRPVPDNLAKALRLRNALHYLPGPAEHQQLICFYLKLP